MSLRNALRRAFNALFPRRAKTKPTPALLQSLEERRLLSGAWVEANNNQMSDNWASEDGRYNAYYVIHRTDTSVNNIHFSIAGAGTFAAEASDYIATAADGNVDVANGVVTFTGNDAYTTINISAVNDDLLEPDETLQLSLLDNYDILQDTPTAQITLKSDDSEIWIEGGGTMNENGGSTQFTLHREDLSGGCTSAMYVYVRLKNAGDGEHRASLDDYQFADSLDDDTVQDADTNLFSLYFAPDQSTRTLTVNAINDQLPEPTEAFKLVLLYAGDPNSSYPVYLSQTLPTQAFASILDDDGYLPPPIAPTNLIANPFSDTAVQLTWADNSTDESNFLVHQSTDGVNWSIVQVLDPNTTSTQIADLTPGLNYSFRVQANNANSSDQSTTPVATANTQYQNIGDPIAVPITTDINAPQPLWLNNGVPLVEGDDYRLIYVSGAVNWPYHEGNTWTAAQYAVRADDWSKNQYQLDTGNGFPFVSTEQEVPAAAHDLTLDFPSTGRPIGAYFYGVAQNFQGPGVTWQLQKKIPHVSVTLNNGDHTTEGDTTPLYITLTRDAYFNEPLTVNYTLIPNSAEATDLNIPQSGTLTLDADKISQDFPIPTTDDDLPEATEDFEFQIDAGSGYISIPSENSVVGYIDDNDELTIDSLTAKDAAHPTREVTTTSPSDHPVLYLGTDGDEGTIQISADVLPESMQGSEQVRWGVDNPWAGDERTFDNLRQGGQLSQSDTSITLRLGQDFNTDNEALVGVGIDSDQNGTINLDEISMYIKVVLVKIDSLSVFEVADPTHQGTNGPDSDAYILQNASGDGIFAVSPTALPQPAQFLRWKVEGAGITTLSYQDGFVESISGDFADRDFAHGIPDVITNPTVGGGNRDFAVSLGFDFDGDDQIDSPGEVFRSLSVHVVNLVLSQVNFGAASAADFFPVYKDDRSGAYSSIAWKDKNGNGTDDAGDDHFPVAYKRNGKMVLTPTFSFLGGVPNWTSTVLIAADAPYAEYRFDPNTVTISGSTLVDSNHWAAGPFQNWIDHFDSFAINWLVSFNNGDTWRTAGTSKNPVYVLLNAPVAAPLLNTVAFLATNQPKGQWTEGGTIDATWAEFADRSVSRPQSDVRPAVEMVYHHDASVGFGANAAEMIARLDGRGQCTAWADLFIRVLAANGITGATTTRIQLGTSASNGFRVKSMPAQGSGAGDYTFAREFGFHQVVVIGSSIYDPSYGSLKTGDGTNKADLLYEDAYVEAFTKTSGLSWYTDTKGLKELTLDPPLP